MSNPTARKVLQTIKSFNFLSYFLFFDRDTDTTRQEVSTNEARQLYVLPATGYV